MDPVFTIPNGNAASVSFSNPGFICLIVVIGVAGIYSAGLVIWYLIMRYVGVSKYTEIREQLLSLQNPSRKRPVQIVMSGETLDVVVGEPTRFETVRDSAGGEDCPICWEALGNDAIDFEAPELRQIRLCQHTYHRECIDRWLSNFSALCPVCKRLVVDLDNGDVLRQLSLVHFLSQSDQLKVVVQLRQLPQSNINRNCCFCPFSLSKARNVPETEERRGDRVEEIQMQNIVTGNQATSSDSIQRTESNDSHISSASLISSSWSIVATPNQQQQTSCSTTSEL